MASPKSKGRMIRVDVKRSKKIASLSKDAAILFFMMIPHFSSHGKMNGSPHFIKGEVVPLLDYMTVPVIERCLKEISDKTSVKWFQFDGLWYLHSTNSEEHQELRDDRKGKDDMPDYSRTTPGVLHTEVEVKYEVKGEVEGEVNSGAAPPNPEDAPVKVKHLDFVYLLPDEYEKLKTRYGPEVAEKWIERVNRYAHKIGEKKFKKKYSSHYHVILEWDEKDGGSNGQSGNGSQKPNGAKSNPGKYDNVGVTVDA